MVSPDIKEQLAKEVSRKQFLQFLTAGVISVFGFSNILGMFIGHKQGGHHTTIVIGGSDKTNGFGASKFGV